MKCPFCGYEHELDDRYGCPNCNGEGLPGTHKPICEEYWDRGLECRCIPEGVKQAIRDGADPEDVI